MQKFGKKNLQCIDSLQLCSLILVVETDLEKKACYL